MVDATRVFEPGFQVTNAAGTPQSGAVLRFYNGTTAGATRTVYSDLGLSTSLGVTVTCNAAGRPAASGGAGAEVVIYTGTTAYAVSAETSAGVALWSFNNVIGALDTSSFLTGTVTAETPVISKTADYPIVNGDQGKVINANPTGGAFTLTLPSAITVQDGWSITIRHSGTANQVKIATVSSQTINGATGRSLTQSFETITLVSDGANWHVMGAATIFFNGMIPSFFIEDKELTTPPGSPTPGARYIVAGTGGSWSTFDTGDIAEADGQGNWIEIDPVEGWRCWIKDENQEYVYTGSTWIPATPLPRGYLDGCTITNNSSDSTNDIDFAAGSCRDSTNAVNHTCAAMTKRLDADFTEGTGNGMRYSGAAITDTTYHLFSITKADGTQDWFAYASVDPTAVLPTGYTTFRRVGSIIRASSAIVGFIQSGDQFWRKVPLQSVATSSLNPGTSALTATLGVPAGLELVASITFEIRAGTSSDIYGLVTSPDQTDTAPSATAYDLRSGSAAGALSGVTNIERRTSTTRTLRYRIGTSSTNDAVGIICHGWLDQRGKNAA